MKECARLKRETPRPPERDGGFEPQHMERSALLSHQNTPLTPSRYSLEQTAGAELEAFYLVVSHGRKAGCKILGTICRFYKCLEENEL